MSRKRKHDVNQFTPEALDLLTCFVSKSDQIFHKAQASPLRHTEAMKQRIDSPQGRALYGRRFAIVEPVFGKLRHNKGLNRLKSMCNGSCSAWCITLKSSRITAMRNKYKGKHMACLYLLNPDLISLAQFANRGAALCAATA